MRMRQSQSAEPFKMDQAGFWGQRGLAALAVAALRKNRWFYGTENAMTTIQLINSKIGLVISKIGAGILGLAHSSIANTGKIGNACRGVTPGRVHEGRPERIEYEMLVIGR